MAARAPIPRSTSEGVRRPEGCAADDRQAWRIANPALACRNPFLSEDGLEAARKTIREPCFVSFGSGQWVTGVEAWLPWGAWDACRTERVVQPGERVVLAFDGSASGDSTALVGCTLDGHLWVEGLWENPGDPRWRVPRENVSTAIDWRSAKRCRRVACDPWGWQSELEAWAQRHGERRVLGYLRLHPGYRRMITYQDLLRDHVETTGGTSPNRHIGSSPPPPLADAPSTAPSLITTTSTPTSIGT